MAWRCKGCLAVYFSMISTGEKQRALSKQDTMKEGTRRLKPTFSPFQWLTQIVIFVRKPPLSMSPAPIHLDIFDPHVPHMNKAAVSHHPVLISSPWHCPLLLFLSRWCSELPLIKNAGYKISSSVSRSQRCLLIQGITTNYPSACHLWSKQKNAVGPKSYADSFFRT